MNIPRLVEKMLVRLLLIITLLPLQSCSNTLIGEKLENSFDTNDNPVKLVKNNNKAQKLTQKTKIISRSQEDMNKIKNDFIKTNQKNSVSNKAISSQKLIKSIDKTVFNPQPYRIILKLSGANPSAPAETVTEALRKAGVQFEVEKIERFYEENLLKSTSLKRK